MRERATRARAARFAPLGTGVALALLALAPALSPARLADGYLLRLDMVFVPRQTLYGDGLGLGSALPRAVPVDFLVAALTSLVPGALLQKAVLFASLVAAVTGAARLVPTAQVLPRVAAGVLYGWNAYVDERLLQGHWALLVGYAALPWVAAAAIRLRAGSAVRPMAALTLGLAVAAVTPTGGVLAALVAVCVVAWPPVRWRSVAATVALAAVVNAPWWLPGALHPTGARSDPAGVALFAAHADTPLGVVGSLLTLGGIWNAQSVPSSRSMAALVPALLVLLAVVAAGVPPLLRRLGAAGRGLLLAAAVGLLLAALAALPGGARLVRTLVEHAPGAGLLRDAQKYVAPLALAEAVAFGLGVERVAARLRDVVVRRALVTVLVLLPVAALPALAWGAFGALSPVRYPAEWERARAVLARGGGGDVVVLPWQAFRRFGWNGDRTVLDPATRYFPRTVVAADDLPVDNRVVRGEDPRSAAVGELVRRGDPAAPALARLGIRYVVVERDVREAATVPARLLAGLTPVWEGTRLAVYQVPGRIAPARAGAPAAAVLTVDVLAALLVAAGTLVLIMPRSGSPPAARCYAARHDE